MGFVMSLTGQAAEAVDHLHKALGLRRDDTFSTTMLGYAIEQLMTDISPCDGKCLIHATNLPLELKSGANYK